MKVIVEPDEPRESVTWIAQSKTKDVISTEAIIYQGAYPINKYDDEHDVLHVFWETNITLSQMKNKRIFMFFAMTTVTR